MQLLIVHHENEVGEELVRMVSEYTEHDCSYASSGTSALQWGRRATSCSLLISQLDGEGVNGLSLGATLSEMFAGMQTMFLPAYAATEQRLEVPQPKVFPEPIDGQRLLDAIAHAEVQRQTGLDLYHSLDVVQMCCLSQRSGALQFVRGTSAAVLFLRSGHIVHAEAGPARGADALAEITTWEAVEFAYDYTMRAPADTIDGAWDEALNAALSTNHTHVSSGNNAPAPALAETIDEPRKARGRLFGGAWKAGLFAMATLLPLISG